VVVKRVDGDVDIDVHIWARYANSLVLDELADRVRAAARASAESTGASRISRIDVFVDDLRFE
jgi:hypothetical protein